MKRLLCVVVLFFMMGGCFYGQTPSAEEDQIGNLFENFEEILSKLVVLTPGELQNLPLGIRYEIGNSRYDLLFTEAELTSSHIQATVYLRVTMPGYSGKDQVLYFGAENLKLTENSVFMSDVKLALKGEYELFSKGEVFRIKLKGENRAGNGFPLTYVVVDCKGIQEVRIGGDLIFNRKYVQPMYNGKVIKNKDLVVSFEGEGQSLEDIYASIRIPEFGIASLKDWSFQASQAVFDFSSLRNAPGMRIYEDAGNTGFFDNLWTGVYIENLQVNFPHFMKNQKGENPSFTASYVWLDENGFTGLLKTENILDIHDGELCGWAFSVENFEVHLRKNQLIRGEMKGKIGIPVSALQSFRYDTEFDTEGNWWMKIQLDKQLKFDFCKSGEVRLNSSSYLKLEKEEEENPYLKACLSGRMTLNPFADTNTKVDLGNVEFVGLTLSTREPYVSLKKLNFDKEIKYRNFPLSVHKVGFEFPANQDYNFNFGLKIHLSSESMGGIAGETRSAIRFGFDETKKHLQYKGFDMEKIKVNYDNAAFKFSGGVDLYQDDKEYGDGFGGDVEFYIKSLKMGMKSKVMFGAMPTFRYWYADLLVKLSPTGIPIFPGFQITGLGGGAYQRMRLESSQEGNTMGGRYTQTGLKYVPDSTIGLGLKAYTELSTLQSDVFNADLALSIAFNNHSGLEYVALKGVGKFMDKTTLAPIQSMGQKIAQAVSGEKTGKDLDTERKLASYDAMVTGVLEMIYDHSNTSFYAGFEAFMDIGLIKGTGGAGALGLCEMYFGKEDWFVKIGEPSRRLGIKLGLGPLSIKTQAYFMTGKSLPPMPAIPSHIERLLKSADSPMPRTRDITSLDGGKGFAFGADFGVSTGDLNFLIFYGKFQVDLGFDIMMKKYQGVYCDGYATEVGVNGWYAKGQAYSYLLGSVGLRAKLFGSERKFVILEGEVATLLEAQLPNPGYFGGAFAFNYSVLGGLLHGKCNFKFGIGDKCELVESGFADGVKIIADKLPEDKAEGVEVSVQPQVAFNIAAEKEIQAVFDGKEKTLKIAVDHFKLSHQGKTLGSGYKIKEDGKVAEMQLHEMLPSQAKVEVDIKVSAKEKVGSGYRNLKTIEGGDYQETLHWSFTTSTAPDTIPWSNVETCYPVRDQQYFLSKEFEKGYVQLKKGQSYLFGDSTLRKRLYLVSERDTLDIAYTYNQSDARLNWRVPELKNDCEYRLCFVLENKSDSEQGTSSQNSSVQTETTSLYDDNQGNTLVQESVRLKAAESAMPVSHTLLSYKFRTSKFSTLKEKMDALDLTKVYATPYFAINDRNQYVPSYDVTYLQAEMQADEGFDEVDLEGNVWSGNQPLIRVTANLDGETYHQQFIYPLLYREYPFGGYVQYMREAENPGLIPDWGIYISQYYEYGEDASNSKTLFPWLYYLVYHYKLDYEQMLTCIADAYWRGIDPKYRSWLKKNFVPMPPGKYGIKLKYRNPLQEEGSSVVKHFVYEE